MSISEPYGWVDGWIHEALVKLGRPAFWVGCAFIAVIAMVVLGTIAIGAAMPMVRHRRSFASAAAVVLLWPVALFVPITISLGCALTSELPTQWQDGTPLQWHDSDLVQQLGACGVPFLAVMFSLPVVLLAHRNIRCEYAEAMRRYCHNCHYDRAGLPDGASCPECGLLPIGGSGAGADDLS